METKNKKIKKTNSTFLLYLLIEKIKNNGAIAIIL
jgi:hypothetical protein